MQLHASHFHLQNFIDAAWKRTCARQWQLCFSTPTAASLHQGHKQQGGKKMSCCRKQNFLLQKEESKFSGFVKQCLQTKDQSLNVKPVVSCLEKVQNQCLVHWQMCCCLAEYFFTFAQCVDHCWCSSKRSQSPGRVQTNKHWHLALTTKAPAQLDDPVLLCDVTPFNYARQ